MYLPFTVDGGSVGLAVGEAEGVGEEDGEEDGIGVVEDEIVEEGEGVGGGDGVVGDGVGFIFNTYNGLLFGAYIVTLFSE